MGGSCGQRFPEVVRKIVSFVKRHAAHLDQHVHDRRGEGIPGVQLFDKALIRDRRLALVLLGAHDSSRTAVVVSSSASTIDPSTQQHAHHAPHFGVQHIVVVLGRPAPHSKFACLQRK